MQYPDAAMLAYGRRAIMASVEYPKIGLPFENCLAVYLSEDDGHSSWAMRASPEDKRSTTYASAP